MTDPVYPTLFITERGSFHQQRALHEASPRPAIIIRLSDVDLAIFDRRHQVVVELTDQVNLLDLWYTILAFILEASIHVKERAIGRLAFRRLGSCQDSALA